MNWILFPWATGAAGLLIAAAVFRYSNIRDNDALPRNALLALGLTGISAAVGCGLAVLLAGCPLWAGIAGVLTAGTVAFLTMSAVSISRSSLRVAMIREVHRGRNLVGVRAVNGTQEASQDAVDADTSMRIDRLAASGYLTEDDDGFRCPRSPALIYANLMDRLRWVYGIGNGGLRSGVPE